MNYRDVRAHVFFEIRAAERNYMTARVADAMREQIDEESGRYRFDLDRSRSLRHGRREARDRAFKRFCAAAFAIAGVVRTLSITVKGRGGGKV